MNTKQYIDPNVFVGHAYDYGTRLKLVLEDGAMGHLNEYIYLGALASDDGQHIVMYWTEEQHNPHLFTVDKHTLSYMHPLTHYFSDGSPVLEPPEEG